MTLPTFVLGYLIAASIYDIGKYYVKRILEE
jgi:hypothetical protein